MRERGGSFTVNLTVPERLERNVGAVFTYFMLEIFEVYNILEFYYTIKMGFSKRGGSFTATLSHCAVDNRPCLYLKSGIYII